MNITDMYEDKFLFKVFTTYSAGGGTSFSLSIESNKVTTHTLANFGSFMPRLSGTVDIDVKCLSNHDYQNDRISIYLYDGDTVIASTENQSVSRTTPTYISLYNVPITAYKKYTVKIKSEFNTSTVYKFTVSGYIAEQSNKYIIGMTD